MSRFRVGGALLIALALVAAGCGGDEADLPGDSTTRPATTTGGGASTTRPGDAGADTGDAVLPPGLSSNECLAAATAIGSAFSGGMTPEGTFDPDRIEDAFDQLSRITPPQVQDDVVVMADALRVFFSALEDEGIDLSDPAALSAPGVADALEEASRALDSAEFRDASDNVSAWFEEACSGPGG